MPRAKQRTPELRDRVLSVGLAILAKEGVGALTTRAVARAAGTSVPAVYELFGDKAGLVREMFFTGFRRLHQRLLERETASDPLTDLAQLAMTFRAFAREEPMLSQLMFSHAFAEFDPGPADTRAGAAVRGYLVDRVDAAVRAGALAGDAIDIAHVLLATVQGLALQENAGWLGSTPTSLERRWALAMRAVLSGLKPAPSA